MPRWTKEDLLRYEQRTKSINSPQIEHAVVGAVGAPKREQGQGAALDQKPSRYKKRKGRLAVVVTLIACRRGELDSDNNVGSLKGTRDAIARSLGVDDGDERVRWCYGQCRTDGETGVIVRIEAI
jgi:hypothetical protein